MAYYHCSPTAGLTVLEPRKPESFEKPARVYMTTLLPMALMYTVRNYEYSYTVTDPSEQRKLTLAQVVYEMTGCIMPRNLERYQPALMRLDEYGLRGKRNLLPLMYCMSLLGEASHFHYMLQKLSGRVCALFFERLEITESAVFIDEGILIVFLPGSFSHKAGRRNIFHINLSPLSGIFHLFIWFWNVFGVGQFYGFPVDTAQELVQPRDGSGIPTLPQLHPEYHQTGMRIPAAHILDQLDLGFCVLVWMTVRAMGTVCQGTNCAVILLTPTVDVLPGGLVADCSSCNTVLQRIFNDCLLKPHVLCYLIHSG